MYHFSAALSPFLPFIEFW